MVSGAVVGDVAHVIQVAVAPVFLLSGIGAMLSLFTVRRARIVDEAGTLVQDSSGMAKPAAPHIERKRSMLSRRRCLMDVAIALATIMGLLICLVIAALFVDYLLQLELSLPIALLFLLAMLCFIGAFVGFLRDILLESRERG